MRIFNTYGPRMKPLDGRVIPNFISQALQGLPFTIYGQGEQTRSFCFYADLVEGILRLLQSSTHEPVNLGNPGEYTIKELAEAVARAVGVSPTFEHRPLPPDDPVRRRPGHRAGSRTARLAAHHLPRRGTARDRGVVFRSSEEEVRA